MSLRKLGSNLAAVAYPGHPHFAKRLLSRRGFLEKSGITLGVLAASGMVPELARAAALKTHGINSTTSATPVPIPGGLHAEAIEIVFDPARISYRRCWNSSSRSTTRRR